MTIVVTMKDDDGKYILSNSRGRGVQIRELETYIKVKYEHISYPFIFKLTSFNCMQIKNKIF